MQDKSVPILGSALLTFVLLIGVSALFIVGRSNTYVEFPGQAVPMQPAQKVEKGEKHAAYLTNPPSSGAYSDYAQRDGIFSQDLADDQLVGALYKRKVVIAYNCNYKSQFPTTAQTATAAAANVWDTVNRQNQGCGEVVSKLREMVERKGTYDIVMAPYKKLESRIAIVSWGRIDKMMWFDEKRISDFIDAYRGKFVPQE